MMNIQDFSLNRAHQGVELRASFSGHVKNGSAASVKPGWGVA